MLVDRAAIFLILVTSLSFPALFCANAEELTRAQLNHQIAELEASLPEIDRKARASLQDLGTAAKKEFLGNQEQLSKNLKHWNADLEPPTGGNIDIESRRAELKEDVRLWTNTIGGWTLEELKRGIADALLIAEHDGLNTAKLQNIYELTIQIIRTADFAPPNTEGLTQLDALNLSTSDRPSSVLYKTFMTLWGLGHTLAESEAKARARHQKYREQMYKRAMVAYVRALISGDTEVAPCQKRAIGHEALLNGRLIPIIGCPDPVVESFKSYAQAIQKIQSADVERFKAEVDVLIDEQQYVTDFLGVAPFVGDAIDIWGVFMGKDLADQCLTPEERKLSALFLAIPIVGRYGPALIRQIEKRSKVAAPVIAKFRLLLDIIVEESVPALTYAYREMGIDLGERLANRFSTTPKKLRELLEYLKSFRPEMSAQAKADMTTFRTVRDAIEAKHWRDELLSPAALKKAKERSGKILAENLGQHQMIRSARIQASNIVPDHVPVLERLAKERNEVIVVRYVNEASTDLIAGGAGTKHMGIKGKSANRGPIQALLPVNQSLNKQGSRLEDLMIAKTKRPLDQFELDEIAKLKEGMAAGEASMNKCLKDPNCAMAIQFPIKHPTASGDTILHVAKDKSKGRVVYFIEGPNGSRLDYRSATPIDIDLDPDFPPQPVLVLADPKTGAPLTADYDFLGLGVEGLHGSPTFDPSTGYVTEQMNDTIEAVNEEIGKVQKKKGLAPQKVVHHGAERWYPHSPGALDVDPFVTVFDPEGKIIRVPRCESDCMKDWCKQTGMCNPAAVCPPRTFTNCIPPDHDRLLKDYYHQKRLEGYDLSPNSVWSWGHYNPFGGWSFVSYLESVRQKAIKTRLAREDGKILMIPGDKIANFGKTRSPIDLSWMVWLEKQAKDLPQGTQSSFVSNFSESLLQKALLPQCQEQRL